jgi:hypothetical protein
MRTQLTIRDGVISVGIAIPLSAFPGLVEEHPRHYNATPPVEALGQELLRSDMSPALLPPFIREVCRWGGYSGVAGRVLKQNTLPDIEAAFGHAISLLQRAAPDHAGALTAINALNGLGRPSFASKLLRFLFPETCPILDSVNQSLGYPATPHGYARFAHDCGAIASALEQAGVPNPLGRPGNRWFVGEVDMAIFAYLRGWDGQTSPETIDGR